MASLCAHVDYSGLMMGNGWVLACCGAACDVLVQLAQVLHLLCVWLLAAYYDEVFQRTAGGTCAGTRKCGLGSQPSQRYKHQPSEEDTYVDSEWTR